MANFLTLVKDFIDNMEDKIKKIMVNIFKISFGICIIATIVLYLYIVDTKTVVIYEVGLQLFKTGIITMTFGFLCSFAFENLRNRMI